MSDLIFGSESYLSHYHTVISIDGKDIRFGRATHVQVFDVSDEPSLPDGVTHVVRFYDGRYFRELPGAAAVEVRERKMSLDMGKGKVYRFIKQGETKGTAVDECTGKFTE